MVFFLYQSGSGFGSSIVFDDINGDGIDDLLIGAPLQYNNDVIDSGVVYIYNGDIDVSRFKGWNKSIIVLASTFHKYSINHISYQYSSATY